MNLQGQVGLLPHMASLIGQALIAFISSITLLQDWDTVVINKRAATSAQAQSKGAVNAALRAGMLARRLCQCMEGLHWLEFLRRYF